MKNINITNIVDPTSLQPFTGNSLKFLQDASSEARAGMIKAFIYNNLGSYSLTVPYVISGCVYSGTTPNFAVTAGEIFYGGEYYEVTAVSGYTNIPQFKLDQTQDATADPLDFSDGQTWSVHDIFKFIGEDTVTAKVFDATDLVSAYGAGKIVFARDAYTGTAIATQTTSSTSYIDLTNATYTTPSTGGNRNWKVTAKSTIGFAPSATETGGSLSIYCASNVDESRFVLVSTVAYVSNAQGTVMCQKILESIAPSTVIKLQIKAATAGSTTFDLNSFIVEEQ